MQPTYSSLLIDWLGFIPFLQSPELITINVYSVANAKPGRDIYQQWKPCSGITTIDKDPTPTPRPVVIGWELHYKLR